MSNKQNYINDYLKENYKTIKFRVRKDDKLMISKLEDIDNVNKYIYGLIEKDIKNNRKYNYINNDVKLNFDVSDSMNKLIKEAEYADYIDNYGLYMNLAYAIDTKAKNEVNKHIITQTQWNRLIARYCL